MDIDIDIILGAEAEIPLYQTNGSAGVDLCSIEEYNLKPLEIKAIRTGISVSIPRYFEGQVRSRSGLSLKGITVWNAPGTIDSDYRGEIKVILRNSSDVDFLIEKGMRIAQLVFSPIVIGRFKECKELSDTQRGNGGFGSTGLK